MQGSKKQTWQQSAKQSEKLIEKQSMIAEGEGKRRKSENQSKKHCSKVSASIREERSEEEQGEKQN